MPARLADISRALKKANIAIEKPNSGSHWKASNGTIVYPIPAHNAGKTEISDAYIRGLCRAFGLDEADFRRKL